MLFVLFRCIESFINDAILGEKEVSIPAEPDLWWRWVLSTILVNIVVSIVSAAVDWLSLNLDWDVLSLRINAIISIASVIAFTLDVPHERCTIRKAVVITGTARSILSHDNGILELLSAFKTAA